MAAPWFKEDDGLDVSALLMFARADAEMGGHHARALIQQTKTAWRNGWSINALARQLRCPTSEVSTVLDWKDGDW